MKCKKCGAENGSPLFEAVHPEIGSCDFDVKPELCDLKNYIRWACYKCHRYHFEDGSLYANPFKARAALSAEAE